MWNKVLLSFLFLFCLYAVKLENTIVTTSTSAKIDFYCPDRIAWVFIAKLRCPKRTNDYHCLQLSEEDTYRETCKKRQVTTPGFYPILDSISVNLDSVRCPSGRYQPRPMFSNDGNKCVYEKSVCNEEGQVVYTDGSTTADRTCRCDYNKGYTFVSSPMDNCHCTSSQEDCSCYLKTCANTSKISQDYTCVEEDSILSNFTYSCSVLQPVFAKGNVEKDKDFFLNNHDTHYNIPKLDCKNRKTAIYAILVLVLSYIVTMVVFYRRNNYNRYNGDLRIKVDKEVYTENIGSFITLMVELVENETLTGFLFGRGDVGEVWWQKNGNDIDLSKERDKYRISSDSNPDLRITNLEVDDEAKYRCYITNKAGKVFCSNLIQVLVLGSGAILQHIPTEVQQRGRGAIDKFKKALKTEVCKQRVIVLIIIGAKSSGKTALWHNLLGKQTDQEKETNNIQNKFYLTVKNGQWKVIDYTVRTITDFIQLKRNPENKESKEETDETVELIILDVPGGKEYYPAFEPVLSRKAIYILLSDVNEELTVETKSSTKSNLLLEREPRIHLIKNGGLIRDWLYSVHSKRLAATEDPSSPLTLTPSVILVGTHMDKSKYPQTVEETIKRHERDVLNCVDQKKKNISKHVSHSFVLSNTNTSELQSLKAAIIDTSDKIPWEEIPVRYKMFEQILDDERNTTVTLSFDEIHQLGKESGYPVIDKREIDQFLSYQHDVKNLIYHTDIPECIIISPNWLYSVIRKLLTAFHYEGENSNYKKKGLISLDLLDRIVGDKELKRNTNQTNQDIISILRKFDIVAIVLREYEETATYYYVPSVIPEEHTVDLVTLFESERRGKTSFLCFSFDFLPPSLVHHVMVKLLSQYSICEQNGNVALYYRTLLVNYDRCTKQKLYFLSNKDELLFQIWYYGVQQISPCFQGLRKIIESTVSNYKSRHKLNIAFTYKLKCPDSKHAATDGWDILDTSRQLSFYCFDHKTNHEDLYTTWFTDSNQTVVHSEGVKRNLGPQFKRESSKRASGPPGDLDEDKQRWLVVGICLHSIISPLLRNYVHPIISNLYNFLVSSHSIDTQVYPKHLTKYPATNRYFLHYESINNNRTMNKNYRNFDYKVTSHVDLSKLFLQPNMVHYSGIDGSCDLSALLSMVININTIPASVQTDAEKMRSDILNPWAHCDFTEWTTAQYIDVFQFMGHFVKDLGLSSREENKVLGELNTWETNSHNYLSEKVLRLEIVENIRQQTNVLSDYVHTLCSENSQYFKVLKELKDLESSLQNRIRKLENKTMEQEVELKNTEITDTKNVEIHKPFSEEKNAYSQRDIKKGVLDAVILNAEKDQEMAMKFINHLKEFIPDIDVELLKEFVKPGVTCLQSTNELFKSARFVLILVTENFKLSMLDRFIGEKVLLESLNDSEKLFRVIPVSVDGPQYMPFELMPLIAIQYYHFQIAKKERKDDSIYINTIRKLFLHGRANYLTEP